MLYSEYMQKARELTVIDDYDGSGYFYLDPNYRVALIDAKLTPDTITDYETSWEQVKESLDLEIERRNCISDKGRFVMDWLFEIISSTIDPAMVTEENELMKNMMDYIKLNHELKEKEDALQKREDIQDKKDNIVELMPGLNFSKRGAK